MRLHLPLCTTVALALVLAGPARAEKLDPAKLLPAKTIAYLEVTQPAQLAREMGTLFKGSAFDKLPEVMADFRAKRTSERYYGFDLMTTAAALLGPEGRTEMARGQGAALAVTGLTKDQIPEVVAILLTGESKLVGIYMRAMFVLDSSIRSVGEVEGIRLYQEMRPDWAKMRYEKEAFGKKPDLQPSGPVYAIDGTVVVIGSNPQVVGDVIRRARGKHVGKSLAENEGFETSARLRARPGLFGYADVAGMVSLLVYSTGSASSSSYREKSLQEELRYLEMRRDREGKKDGKKGVKGDDKEDEKKERYTDQQIARVKQQLKRLKEEDAELQIAAKKKTRALTTQLKALRSITAGLTFQEGNPSLNIRVNFDPNDKSPLVELLPSKKVNPELLNFVPADSPFAMARSLDFGGKKWQQVLKLLDTLAADPRGMAPTKVIAALEDKLEIKFGKDVLAKISGFAFALAPMRVAIPRGGHRIPLLVIEASDQDAARSLAKLLPTILGLAQMSRGEGDKAATPSKETVDDQTVYSLAGSGLPWRTAIQYGTQGRFLVIGQNPKFVAGVLAAGANKKGLLGDERVAEAIKALEKPVGIGVWSAGQTLVQLIEQDASFYRNYLVKERPDRFKGEKGEKPEPNNTAPSTSPQYREYATLAQGYARDLARVTKSLPPMIISVTRSSNHLSLEARQTGLKAVSARVLGILVPWQLEKGRLPSKYGYGEKEKISQGDSETTETPIKPKEDKKPRPDKPNKQKP